MFLAGILFIGVSLIWNIWYPINKEIWSSSYNLLTGGLSLILLSVFYFIIDVNGKSRWAFPLIIIGLNPITVYMANRMVNFKYTAEFLFNGVIGISGDFATVLLSIGVLILEWLFLYFLYKKNIFLKV